MLSLILKMTTMMKMMVTRPTVIATTWKGPCRRREVAGGEQKGHSCNTVKVKGNGEAKAKAKANCER